MSLVQELQKQKKSSIWKKVVLWVFVVWVSYWAYTMYFSDSQDTEKEQTIKTYTVKKWDIKLSISWEWKITKLE